MSEFKIPPISTLIGSDIRNFYRVIKFGGRVAPASYGKLLLTALVILVSTPFHLFEWLYFRDKVSAFVFRKEPLFILGHWRSGTTYLHNLLCADPGAGYVTTYHSVFPNNLASKFIFKPFMKMNMPAKRPSDNVKLGIDLPQEDEFAMGNLTQFSFYHSFYFPLLYRNYYTASVDEVNDNRHVEWDKNYRQLIIKAMLNSKGRRAVIKNPVNTARVKSLLRIFPDAKFVFIYRNPVTVFLSTQKFFQELFPEMSFSKVNNEFLDEMIFENFLRLMKDYDNQKYLIPSKNLLEIRFEDLEKSPLTECSKIYKDILEEDFEYPKTHLEKYLQGQRQYTKNVYQINRNVLDKILSTWGPYMKAWKYDIPDDVKVV